MHVIAREPRLPAEALPSLPAHGAAPRLSVRLARSDGDVEDARRLRYKVFAEELGAEIGRDGSGLDGDEFDAYCDHLVVRDEDSLRVVGTYRILPPDRARDIGKLYSESEFDLTRLAHLRPALVEVGRSCVHRDYRSGATILLLWAGLARYMTDGGYRHLIGCASACLGDGGGQDARLRDELQRYLTGPEYRVFPHHAFPHHRIERAPDCEVPPLIKGYLRLGARVCGEPAWDPAFNSADFLIWLSLDRLNRRYARHFDLLAQQATAARRASSRLPCGSRAAAGRARAKCCANASTRKLIAARIEQAAVRRRQRRRAATTPLTSPICASARRNAPPSATSIVKLISASPRDVSVFTPTTFSFSRANTSEMSRSRPWRSSASTETSTGNTASCASPQVTSISRSGERRDRACALAQWARWIDTPLPRVTKPTISSGGTGRQQRAKLVNSESTPTTST